MRKSFFFFILFSILPFGLFAQSLKVSTDWPAIIIEHVPVSVQFQLLNESGTLQKVDTTLTVSGLTVQANDENQTVTSISFKDGKSETVSALFSESGHIPVSFPQVDQTFSVRVINGWWSLVPPLVAIILALLARQVVVALFVGIWVGATIIFGFNPFYGLLYSLTEYIGRAAAVYDKLSILIFSLVLGGMVGVISKMGGTQGIVDRLSVYASNSKRGQFVTWLMGVFIFFDDYANTLIVGNTMRPLTDKLKVSREKLAYLVDSTAAPVANIAVISTWIGFELSLIGAAFVALGITDNAYITFFKTIPYNFYPIFALIFGLTIALSGRDFGPMLKAERRANKTGALLSETATPISSLDASEITADEGTPRRWYNGFIPIAVVISTTLIGLWFTGLASVRADGVNTADMGAIHFMSTVIGASDSYSVLMWAAFFGSFTAIGLAVAQKLLSLEDSIMAWVGGIKAMMIAAIILTLAWAIGNICTDLKTADFVILISKDYLSPHLLPALSFLIAAVISFATGTSWGVMAILMPIVIPVAHLLPQNDPTISATLQHSIFLSTIASVLAGATFGDHCSPISDTTIMSSMASGSDHIDHVRTQLPYALVAGGMSVVAGYMLVGFGLPNWAALLVGIAGIVILIRFFGSKVSE